MVLVIDVYDEIVVERNHYGSTSGFDVETGIAGNRLIVGNNTHFAAILVE